MRIRAAHSEDFEKIFEHKEFIPFNWEYVEYSCYAVKAKNTSLFIEYEGNEYIFPLMTRKILGFYPVSFSLLFGMYGGIIPEKEIDTKTYEYLMRGIKKYIGTDIIFQNPFQEEILSKTNFTKIKQEFTHVVQAMDQNYDKFYYAEFSKGMREGVKRGIKNDIKISVGNNIELVEDLYKLYEVSNVRWGKKTPRYGLDFFKVFLNKEYIEIRVAYYQGQPLSSLFILKFKKYYFCWFGGMVKEFRKLRANDYLYSDVIKTAIENNYTMVNFGGSGKLAGVKSFKESFGAKEKGYHIYFIGNTIAKWALYFIIRFY